MKLFTLVIAILMMLLVNTGCLRQELYVSGKTSIMDKSWRSDIKVGQSTKHDVIERLGQPEISNILNDGETTFEYVSIATVMKTWSYDPTHKLIFITHQTPYHYGVTFVFNERGLVKDILGRGELNK